jgi:hypothetical protein
MKLEVERNKSHIKSRAKTSSPHKAGGWIEFVCREHCNVDFVLTQCFIYLPLATDKKFLLWKKNNILFLF